MKNNKKLKILFYVHLLLAFLFYEHTAFAEEDLHKDSECLISKTFNIDLLTEPKFVYLKINNLCEETPRNIGIFLRDFFSKHPDDFSGIVLDLRQTGTGLLSSVASITSIFLPANTDIDTFRDSIGRGI